MVARLSEDRYFVLFYHLSSNRIAEVAGVVEFSGSPSTGYKFLPTNKNMLVGRSIQGMEGFVPIGDSIGKTTIGNLIGSSNKIGQAELEYKGVGELKNALVIARRAVSQPNGNRSKIGWPINSTDIVKADEVLERYKVPSH